MELNGLRSFLNPKSIAVIGASEKVFYSREMINNLVRYEYKHKIFPINPKYSSILGIPCYPSLGKVQDKVDLAIVVIGRDSVLQSIKDCKDKGVRNVLILSTGFGEADETGKVLQKELGEIANSTGIRICGPNCLGFLNIRNSVIASPLPSWKQNIPMKKGRIGLISQSGGLGVGMFFQNGFDRNIGFSYVVTTGNEVDLDITDFMEYLVEDTETSVIALAIEGLRNPKRFLSLLGLASQRGKPVVVLKMGRTNAGSKAALSHTGAITGSKQVFDAVMRQRGALNVDDTEDLLELASLLDKCPPVEGDGIAVITTSGGLATYLSDVCEEFNLQLPDIEGTTIQRELLSIKGLLTFGNLRNPVDIRGQGIDVIDKVVKPFADDNRFSIIVTACEVCGTDELSVALAKKLIEISSDIKKPIIAIWTGNRIPEDHHISDELAYRTLENSRVPLFHNPQRAIRVIKSYVDWGYRTQRHDSQPEQLPETQNLALEKSRKIKGILSDKESIELLSSYAIPIVPGKIVTSVKDALLVAKEVSYPVAVKASTRDIPHLSEARALRLNVKSEEELIDAYNDAIANSKAHNPTANLEGVYVQKMVQGGVEIIVGVSTDELFGPYIVFGLGGVFVEVVKDFSIRLPPVSEKEAEQMVREIRGAKVLEGFRGLPKMDIKSLVQVITRLSLLAKDLEDIILEIDINPLIVLPEGKGAQAVDLLVRFK